MELDGGKSHLQVRPFGVSLIMATVGRCDEVGRMIESLAGQSDRRFELIIVDQNKDDRLSSHIARALHSGIDVQHIRIATRGLSAARNNGLQRAKYELLGFPDDDCWYEPETIREMLEAFDQSSDLAAGSICWVEQWAALGKSARNDSFSWSIWQRFRGGPASSISLFVRAEVLSLLGAFDESLGVGTWFGAGEETDLTMRMLRAHHKIQYIPSSRVHHLFGSGAEAPLGTTLRNARSRGRGTGALYVKHALPITIWLRGLIAPPLTELFRRRNVAGLLIGIATTFGRIEGSLARMCHVDR